MEANLNHLEEAYRKELIGNIIPFWEKYSVDTEYGGYFTCLNRKGDVFDTDKFIWLQCRQVWMFSFLFSNFERNGKWLETAEHGACFLKNFGRDNEGNWFFSLSRKGEPLIAPYNIFSDCFASMAFGQLSKATGKDEYALISAETFKNILRRSANPKGQYNKSVQGTRPLKGLSLPMIMCNLSLQIEHLITKELLDDTIRQCIHEVMELFYDPLSGLIRENINPDGSFSDTFEGRLINPGHGIEAMWFIMDLASENNDKHLINRAKDITLDILNFSWDREFGGIFYFLDLKGKPLQQLEWDQKLWWVHVETLISLIKGYYLTGDAACLNWFKKVHDYTWTHFPDPEYGEWFGYLNRGGEVLLPLKGGKWKGCFHIPRGLFEIWKTLKKINSRQSHPHQNNN